MSEEYNASYYNEGRTFIVVDNSIGREYVYPKTRTREDINEGVYSGVESISFLSLVFSNFLLSLDSYWW